MALSLREVSPVQSWGDYMPGLCPLMFAFRDLSSGELFVIVFDMREGSDTFSAYEGVEGGKYCLFEASAEEFVVNGEHGGLGVSFARGGYDSLTAQLDRGTLLHPTRNCELERVELDDYSFFMGVNAEGGRVMRMVRRPSDAE